MPTVTRYDHAVRVAFLEAPGEISREEAVGHVLEEIRRWDACASPRRWAIVAAVPVHYGMSRLFQAHAESRGIEVAVFTTRGRAVDWLSSADPAQPV